MKRFLVLYAPIATLVLLVTIGTGIALTRADLERLKDSEATHLDAAKEVFLDAEEWPLGQLLGLLRDPALQRASQSPPVEAARAVEARMLGLVHGNVVFDQTRWLNASGMEMVRVDRRGVGAEVIARADLQDKSARYYFKDAIRLAPGRVYISPIDLNIENEVVEVPHKPMIRLAIRLPEVNGRDQGLFVINVRAQFLLDSIVRTAGAGTGRERMLLNSKGFWLLAPDLRDAWGFMFGRETTLAKRQPLEWARIASEPSGQLESDSGLWSWRTLDPAARHPDVAYAAENWKLVGRIPAAEIAALRWRTWRALALVAAISLLVLGILAARYRRLWDQRESTRAELALLEKNRLAGEEIRRQRDVLALAQHSARIGTWHWDMASGRLDWSTEMFELFGLELEKDSATLETWRRTIHPDDREGAERRLEASIEGRSFLDSEYRIICRDGETRWIQALGKVDCDAADHPCRMAGLCIDITSRRRAQEALAESEAWLRLAVHSGGIGLWDWNLLSERVRFSAEWKSQLGYSEAEVSDRFEEWERRVHPEDLGPALDKIRSFIANPVGHHSLEARLRHKDGSYRWILAQADLLRGPDGNPLRMMGSHIDITRMKRTEEQLRASLDRLAAANAELVRASKLKDQFLSTMSHELRTPLGAILTMSGILLEEAQGPLPQETLRQAKVIESSGQHLLTLINDIIEVARIDAGKAEVDLDRCLLSEVGGAVLSRYRRAVKEKSQTLTLSVDRKDLSVETDGRRLVQLLRALLDNAVKFTPQGGEIGIEMTGDEKEKTVRIVVWDTGIGIAKEDLGKIFEPFTQLDARIDRAYGGTGLGLALVERLARLIGASISVESDVGKGCRFILTLPWTPPAGVDGSHRISATGSPEVLVVEDSAGTLSLDDIGKRIPADLRGRLLAAVVSADTSRMEAVLDRLAESDMEAARLVRELLDHFDYEKVLSICAEEDAGKAGGETTLS